MCHRSQQGATDQKENITSTTVYVQTTNVDAGTFATENGMGRLELLELATG